MYIIYRFHLSKKCLHIYNQLVIFIKLNWINTHDINVPLSKLISGSDLYLWFGALTFVFHYDWQVDWWGVGDHSIGYFRDVLGGLNAIKGDKLELNSFTKSPMNR